MKIAIMQPYFFPYIGYFQLMNAVDEFVIYDNIQFSKRGWINRNRVLINGKDEYITIPLKKDSDYLDIRERYLSENWNKYRKKMLNKLHGAYRKAPFFDAIFPTVEKCILFNKNNLFLFLQNSITVLSQKLEIQTSFTSSSTITINHKLKAEQKVIAICKAKKTNVYINPIGGLDLYNPNNFNNKGINLHFLKTKDFIYKQFENVYIPSLSIIDVMMFNSIEKIKEYLNKEYTIL